MVIYSLYQWCESLASTTERAVQKSWVKKKHPGRFYVTNLLDGTITTDEREIKVDEMIT